MTTSGYRHAKGFGAYVKATMERRHRVLSVWTDAKGTYCAECAYPVTKAKETR